MAGVHPRIQERAQVQIIQAGKCATCVGSLGTLAGIAVRGRQRAPEVISGKTPKPDKYRPSLRRQLQRISVDYLVSSDDDDQSSVQTVRVRDTGSKVMYANVDLHGVPVKGVIDSGADITILGGDLFKTVATVAKLKKKNFRKADKTPRTYDQRPFVLHGCMDLDISFEDQCLLQCISR